MGKAFLGKGRRLHTVSSDRHLHIGHWWSDQQHLDCCDSGSVNRSVLSNSLLSHGLPILLCPWNSPGKNTGVGCHSFFQGIFPTQGLSPGLLHCRQILYHLSHQGSSSLSSRRRSNSMEERIFLSSWKFPIYSMSKFQKHFAYQHSPTSFCIPGSNYTWPSVDPILILPVSPPWSRDTIVQNTFLLSPNSPSLNITNLFQLNIRRSKHELESMYELLIIYIHLSNYLVSGF